jgi:hypothetical protein
MPVTFVGFDSAWTDNPTLARSDLFALLRRQSLQRFDAKRIGRDAGCIADEVIAHLSGLIGSSVKVTLEIEAVVSSGGPENIVRTVTERSRMKFVATGLKTNDCANPADAITLKLHDYSFARLLKIVKCLN